MIFFVSARAMTTNLSQISLTYDTRDLLDICARKKLM